jgi:hypothetical protein
MGRLSIYATPTKKPLSQIAVIDPVIIQQIASELPPSNIVLTTENIAQIASQVDISGKVDKLTGHSLVADTEIAKIHVSGSDNQDLSQLQAHVNSTHAPASAQVNADITKAEIEAKLIGEITSHTHPGGGGGLSQQQIEGLI